MKKMTTQHAAAIATSRLFLHKALDHQLEPRFKREIEKDIELLTEVRLFLLHGLYTPNLPFVNWDKPDGTKDAGHPD